MRYTYRMGHDNWDGNLLELLKRAIAEDERRAREAPKPKGKLELCWECDFAAVRFDHRGRGYCEPHYVAVRMNPYVVG